MHIKKKMKKNNTKEKKFNLVSQVALFVAFVSLLLSGFISYKTIEHNKLSVMPHLDVGIRFLEGTEYDNGITLDNAGLGTAIIDSVSIYWNEDNNWVLLDGWEQLSKKLKIQHVYVVPLKFNYGNAVRSGSSLVLYGVKWQTNASIQLQDNQESVQVIVHYRSLYGDKKSSALHIQ